MNQRTSELNEASGTKAHDIQTVVAAAKDGLEPAAHQNLNDKLSSAKASLSDAARPAVDEATRAARAADGYVRSKPWTVIGIAAAVGAFVGFLTGKR